MATLEKVRAQIAKLQAQADALIKSQSSTVIAKIHDLMEKHAPTIADIDAHAGGKKRGRKPGAKAVAKPAASAKYRDPKTGATWSGYGRAPTWIASAKDRTKFLINDSAAQPSATAKRTAKAGNYVRGLQAPKYRDPRSGATWSGRGPAPAWLASVKDRSKFLIAGVKEESSDLKSVPTTKATVKRAVTKKVAGRKVPVKKVVAKEAKAVAKPAPPRKATAGKAVAKKPMIKRAPVKKAPRGPEPVAPSSDVASDAVAA